MGGPRGMIGDVETAGENLDQHSVVERGGDRRIYKTRSTPRSERGVNMLPAKEGDQVPVVWGVVHDIAVRNLRLTPVGKAILAQNFIMKLLVEKGYYQDPEGWGELSPETQEAWTVIAADWFPDVDER